MTTIEEIYAKIPHVPCKGLCQQSCGPIGCSHVEAEQLQNNGINLPKVVDHPKFGGMTCSHLKDDGKCAIYENRPLICRLFGAVKRMKCPHGCTPKGGYLDQREAEMMLDFLDQKGDKPPYSALDQANSKT